VRKKLAWESGRLMLRATVRSQLEKQRRKNGGPGSNKTNEKGRQMPFLMVNLDDPADCRRAIQELRRCVQSRRGVGVGGGSAGLKRGEGGLGGVESLPLGQKLRRIRQRGLWRHLVGMAELPDQPRSLAEWDSALSLPPNKMRSLKAIMAKLENRFAIRFLVPTADASQDEAGNPRYAIPARLRAAILRLSKAKCG
jgi:hypothetical protein